MGIVTILAAISLGLIGYFAPNDSIGFILLAYFIGIGQAFEIMSNRERN